MASLRTRPPPLTARYPWSDWLNGEVWQLYQGDDYAAVTKTMAAAARGQAQRHGGRVRTRLIEDGGQESIVLQFFQP